MVANAIRWAAVAVSVLWGGIGIAGDRAADRPEPSDVHGWMRAFGDQKRQLVAAPADILFVGDSLTEYWSATGSGVWELEFHDFRAVNFGMAGDRTENILFRLVRAGLASNAPRVVVLLAGTNNLSREPPDPPGVTAAAIEAIVGYLVKQCPDTRVFVLTLPPNGVDPGSALRRRVLETNRRLREVDFPDRVELIDIYPVFADESDRWRPGMTIDGTHFSLKGYDHLARALRPAIEALRDEVTPE